MVREARTPHERVVSCEVMKGIEVRLLNSKLRRVVARAVKSPGSGASAWLGYRGCDGGGVCNDFD